MEAVVLFFEHLDDGWRWITDSPSLQMAMILMKFLLEKMPVKTEISEYSGQLATVVSDSNRPVGVISFSFGLLCA